MRTKVTYGAAGGIYRWYIDKFLNTPLGLGINTIWFLSVFPPGYVGNGDESRGYDLLKKSYNFLNQDNVGFTTLVPGRNDGFDSGWKYLQKRFGDTVADPLYNMYYNALVFLLAKEVTIPGVSLDVTQQGYPATGGSGAIACPTITSARKNNDHLSIEMYLTDYSFPNIILRPWIRALSIYGMTDSRLRGKIIFTQMSKRNPDGARGFWHTSNVIELDNAYPVSIPSYNMNYQGVDIDKTMTTEWGYDIINVKNVLAWEEANYDYTEQKNMLDSGAWGAAVTTTGGEVEEPLQDTGGNWNEPDERYIKLRNSEVDHGANPIVNPDGTITGQRVEDFDKVGTGSEVKHWVNSKGVSNPSYKVSKGVNHREWEEGLDAIRYYPNETPSMEIRSLKDDQDYLGSWVPYIKRQPGFLPYKKYLNQTDTRPLTGSIYRGFGSLSYFAGEKPIKIKNTFGTGSHDATTGNEDTVMLNGWPFALHHYIPAFYNLFDFLTKKSAPEPKIVLDKQGDTPLHHGASKLGEVSNPDDDSTITGDIEKKDDIKTPIDDTPYKYDSLGITKIGEVPPNDSNITGDIPKKDNEKVKTPDTPGSRLTVPMIQENVPTDDHVNGRLTYGQNVNTPTDDHITGSLEFSNTRSTPTDDSRRDGESVPYVGRADSPDQDYRKTGSGVGYKNLNTEPQGQVLTGQLQSYVPRGTTNGPGLGELYSEIETSTNDVPLFAEVAKKIIIDSDSLSVN